MFLKSRRVAAGVALATSALFAAGTGTAHASGWKDPRCHEGTYGCVYLNTQRGVSYAWYTYGAHNVHNVIGQGAIINMQYGGAVAYACSRYNGLGYCKKLGPAISVYQHDLTWVYSVYLAPR